MPRWTPDPTFYDSPRHAMQAPAERLAYVALLSTGEQDSPMPSASWTPTPRRRATAPWWGAPISPGGQRAAPLRLERVQLALCPYAPHAHIERRYLIVPGIHTSHIHILDTKPDPRRPSWSR